MKLRKRAINKPLLVATALESTPRRAHDTSGTRARRCAAVSDRESHQRRFVSARCKDNEFKSRSASRAPELIPLPSISSLQKSFSSARHHNVVGRRKQQEQAITHSISCESLLTNMHGLSAISRCSQLRHIYSNRRFALSSFGYNMFALRGGEASFQVLPKQERDAFS